MTAFTIIALFVTTYVAAVADLGIAPWLTIRGISPCFLALVPIAGTVAARPNAWQSLLMGVVGLMFDLTTGGHVGVGMACFSLSAALVSAANPLTRRLSPLERSLATFPAATILLLTVAAGNALFGRLSGPLSHSLVHIVGAGAYTAAVSLPVWMIVDWRQEARRGTRAMTLS